jgi:hypothetical protein
MIAVLLGKVFVTQFYRTYASLFLLLIGLAAGFLSGYEHKMMAEYFISSAYLLLIPVAVWLVYTIIVFNFNKITVDGKDVQFLSCFVLLSAAKRCSSSLITITAQFIPVIGYGMFLILIAVQNEQIMMAVTILATLAALLMVSVYIFLRTLQKNNRHDRVNYVHRWIARLWTKPPFTYAVHHLFHSAALPTLGFKAFSLAILYACCHLSASGEYDMRIVAIGATISFSLQLPMIVSWHGFEQSCLSIFRQLPLGVGRRIKNIFGTLILLFVPEIALLAKKVPDAFDWATTMTLTLYAISIPLVLYGYMFVRSRTQEQAVPFGYFLSIALFLLVLAQVPLVVLTSINTTAGLLWYHRHYYSYEQAEN